MIIRLRKANHHWSSHLKCGLPPAPCHVSSMRSSHCPWLIETRPSPVRGPRIPPESPSLPSSSLCFAAGIARPLAGPNKQSYRPCYISVEGTSGGEPITYTTNTHTWDPFFTPYITPTTLSDTLSPHLAPVHTSNIVDPAPFIVAFCDPRSDHQISCRLFLSCSPVWTHSPALSGDLGGYSTRRVPIKAGVTWLVSPLIIGSGFRFLPTPPRRA